MRLYLAVMVVVGLSAGCAVEKSSLPDPLAHVESLASRYPADQGIENDPAVLFAEDFDHAPLPAIMARFSNGKRPESFSLVADGPSGSAGRQALRISSVGGSSPGGTLYKRLSQGYDRLFFRYYIKYPLGGTFHHTSAWLGGYHPPTDWPQGNAGMKPAGHDRFSIAVEPVHANGRLDFYTYWMGMRGGPTDFWGNFLIHDPGLMMTRDRWMCVEVMASMNEPVSSVNGELALWIDGALVSHLGPGFPRGTWAGGIFTPGRSGEPFEGFQWRNDSALQLNWFHLQHYTTNDPAGYIGYVLYDHVVLATSRIGCLSAPQTAP